MNDIYNEMAARWPSSIVARAEVKKFTGGGISPKTLANADSKGIGPEERFFHRSSSLLLSTIFH